MQTKIAFSGSFHSLSTFELDFELKKLYHKWILRISVPTKRGITQHSKPSGSNQNYQYATGIHFGFMQIKKIAKGCRLGNKAEFVLGPHMSANQQKTK